MPTARNIAIYHGDEATTMRTIASGMAEFFEIDGFGPFLFFEDIGRIMKSNGVCAVFSSRAFASGLLCENQRNFSVETIRTSDSRISGPPIAPGSGDIQTLSITSAETGEYVTLAVFPRPVLAQSTRNVRPLSILMHLIEKNSSPGDAMVAFAASSIAGKVRASIPLG